MVSKIDIGYEEIQRDIGTIKGGVVGLTGLAGLGIIVGSIFLGPIDFGRSVYNQIIGDTPALKRRLVNYVRPGITREIKKENIGVELGGIESDNIERRLAAELDAPIPMSGEKIDPNQCSIEDLWDASEDYAHNWYDRWVWPLSK